MDHAYWGPQFGQEDIRQLLAAYHSELSAAGCIVEEMNDEETSVGAPRQQLRTARSLVGFKGEWNGARARSAIARSYATPAALT